MRNKRMIALLLIICVVLTCLPVPVSAAGVVESGKAGKNVTWTMYDDGTLVFSGIGPTDDNDDSTIKNWCRHAREVKHIVFEEGIAYIGEWFFKSSYKFKRLESVTIPATVTAIGKYAFNGLGPYMKRVYISDLAKFCSIDFKGSSASPLSNVDLYLNGEKVETLVIPDTVKAIPEQTFLLCTSIKTVVIPPNVKTIGSLAFGSCNSLTKVVFQGDAPTVDGKLFTNITPYVYYPQNNKTWTKEVIDAYNDNATWIAYNPAAEDVLSDAYPGGEPQSCIEWYFDEETSTLIFSGRGDMEDYYAAWKEWRSETQKVIFEEGITDIGNYVLGDFQQVTEVVLPSTLKTIGRGAFHRCVLLEKISIPDGVTYIGNGAFSECRKLSAIEIPYGITEIKGDTFSYCKSLAEVALPEGLTIIGADAFRYCDLKKIEIPQTVQLIGDNAFNLSLTNNCDIILPESLEIIGQNAFADCSGIQRVFFLGDVPSIQANSFRWVTANGYYPADNQTWTEDVLQNYGGTLTWSTHSHSFTSVVTEPTCVQQGYTVRVCAECGHQKIDTYTDALGHKVDQWEVTVNPGCISSGQKQGICIRCEQMQTAEVPAAGHQWDNESLLIKTCTVCGTLDGGYRIDLDAKVLGSAATVCIDGKEYPVSKDDTGCYVLVTQTDATNITAYTYNAPNAGDLHLQYPIGMKVWILKFADGSYQAAYMKEFDNLLQYSGSSIRITGKKGIRMITSIDKSTKKALTGKGLAGYTLEEYGTALAWASDLENDNPLVLGKAYTKSNFAYKKGKADPVFKDTGKLIQYTNVLVGFNDNQCVPDIAMRPYIILKDGQGNLFTIYGGIVYRSIGYIAYQNRTAFKAGTSSYKYVWGIIHYVYGTKYDADYQK